MTDAHYRLLPAPASMGARSWMPGALSRGEGGTSSKSGWGTRATGRPLSSEVQFGVPHFWAK